MVGTNDSNGGRAFCDRYPVKGRLESADSSGDDHHQRIPRGARA